ncbi:MAG: DNA-deoxyinosine glycosylase [Prevotella sp.]|jgi:TDG/mug DNA glycosylase family protein|nr:DNA-deoxyinosine glycosylase [Prevotella sp.]
MPVSFPPLIDDNSRVLLLGTMPGAESLRKQEYYGHPHNHFWKIMYALFDAASPPNPAYSEKTKLLLAHRVALWDVLACCERKGSLDSSIRNETANDFSALYARYPQIKRVFFTSRKAEEYYGKYVGKQPDITFCTLPSPSPANAQKTLTEKIAAWQIVALALAEL